MSATEERLLSLEDVANRLQVSDQSVRRWIKAGKLAAYKPGLEWRIRPSDLEDFLQDHSYPKVQAPLPESAEERRESAIDIALEAARRQLTQDKQAVARVHASEGRPQTYFKDHENAAVMRLLEYSKDELVGGLMEFALRFTQLEEKLNQATEASRKETAEESRSGSA